MQGISWISVILWPGLECFWQRDHHFQQYRHGSLGASEVNLAHIFHTSIALAMFLTGFLVAVINQLLMRRFDLPRFLDEVVFIACFSYFINLFTSLFSALGLPDLPLPWRLVAGLFGHHDPGLLHFLLPKGKFAHAPE